MFAVVNLAMPFLVSNKLYNFLLIFIVHYMLPIYYIHVCKFIHETQYLSKFYYEIDDDNNCTSAISMRGVVVLYTDYYISKCNEMKY